MCKGKSLCDACQACTVQGSQSGAGQAAGRTDAAAEGSLDKSEVAAAGDQGLAHSSLLKASGSPVSSGKICSPCSHACETRLAAQVPGRVWETTIEWRNTD